MNKFYLRFILLMIILSIFAAGVGLLKRNSVPSAKRIDLSQIPLSIGGWQGEDAPVDQETKDILETDAVLVRKYTKAGQSAWVSVVHYENSRVALHLPESCSVGHGSFIALKDIQRINLPREGSFSANRFIVKGNKGDQVIIYYFETDKLRTSSYQGMRWEMMKNKVRARNNSGALIRFTAFIGKSREETTEMLMRFIGEAAPLLSKCMFQ